jgi:hypothetical protein
MPEPLCSCGSEASAATLRTITVPHSPIGLAVDARGGPAVVAAMPIPQRSALDVRLDDISGLLSLALSHRGEWSRGRVKHLRFSIS